MKQLKCLIIDDEPLAQDVIENYIANFSFINLIAKCDNALVAIDKLKKEKIDLIFLDISMPFISGIDFIKSLQSPLQIILTTAHKEFAVEGYELNVVDYLVKNGIAANRLEAIGHGETQLVVKNASDDFEHQLNRRTMLKVIK